MAVQYSHRPCRTHWTSRLSVIFPPLGPTLGRLSSGEHNAAIPEGKISHEVLLLEGKAAWAVRFQTFGPALLLVIMLMLGKQPVCNFRCLSRVLLNVTCLHGNRKTSGYHRGVPHDGLYEEFSFEYGNSILMLRQGWFSVITNNKGIGEPSNGRGIFNRFWQERRFFLCISSW